MINHFIIIIQICIIIKGVRTKKGEKEKLRIRILEKALTYLKRHGRSGSGTDPLMDHVGLTRGALYSHFIDKDDLFVQAISHDLTRLENSVRERIQLDGRNALSKMIDDHLSEKTLKDVGSSCVFTSLSSDMNRGKAAHRAIYEGHVERLYDLFSEALKKEFPTDGNEGVRAKAMNLYSGLVGTLTMARTVRNPELASQILASGRKFLKTQFT